jgi:hypothetical protein
MQNVNNNGVEMCSGSSAAKQHFQGVAQTQVWRLLRHDGFYPYHFQRVQHLLLGYYTNCATTGTHFA